MENQTQEMETLLTDIRSSWSGIAQLPDQFSTLERDFKELRRGLAASRTPRHRQPGPIRDVSDDCAAFLAASFIAHAERSGKIEALVSSAHERDALINTARDVLNIQPRAALTTTEVPLPSVFTSEIRELISSFGVVRKAMSSYPITRGTVRPARVGVRPAFGSIAMSGVIGEKSPTFTFASLECYPVEVNPVNPVNTVSPPYSPVSEPQNRFFFVSNRPKSYQISSSHPSPRPREALPRGSSH
jgi:hypothetical protein